MRDGPRGFRRGFTCPAVLRILNGERDVSTTGLSPSLVQLPNCFVYVAFWQLQCSVLQPQRASSLVWALSVSLAATREIDVSFSSCSYLDVSVHCVYRLPAMNSLVKQAPTKVLGFPHSEISGSKRTYRSPKHIGVSPVLHRLLVPRHSPCALHNLTYMIFDHFD